METHCIFREVITNFTQRSATWEFDSSSSGQESFDIFRNPNAHYIINKSLPIASRLNQLKPILKNPNPPIWDPLDIIFPSIPRYIKWSPSFRVPHQNASYISILPQGTEALAAHLTLLYWLSLILFGEEYKTGNFKELTI